MHSISRINRMSLFGVAVIVMGIGLYLTQQPDVGADTITCSTDCAYITVKLNGLDNATASKTDIIASITILNPDGSTAAPGSSGSTGSKTFLYPVNVFDSSFVPGVEKIGPFTAGNGYTVIIGDLDTKKGSWYKLVDPSTARQVVNLAPNQNATVNYNLALAGGGQVSTTVTIFPNDFYRPTPEKFADTVLTCGSQTFNGVINYSTSDKASALLGTIFTPPAGTCSLEIKNYDTNRYRINATNPATFMTSNRDTDRYFNFELLASKTSPSPSASTSGSASSSSPASAQAIKSSPSSVASPKVTPKATPKATSTTVAKSAAAVKTTTPSPAPQASVSPVLTPVTPSPIVTKSTPLPKAKKTMSKTSKIGLWTLGFGGVLSLVAIVIVLL